MKLPIRYPGEDSLISTNENTSSLAVSVASDTMDDSLYCSETLPSLRAESQENNRSSIEEEAEPSTVEIVHPHPPARQYNRSSIEEEVEPSTVEIVHPDPPARQSYNEMFRMIQHFTQRMSESIPSFPYLDWTEPRELWEQLNERALRYPRSPMVWIHHPSLRPNMRSALLKWMADVCEVLTLHRETYYLAVAYFDCYLHRLNNIPPSQLQLIGVTALFLAAKMEEISAPGTIEFGQVCGEAVSQDMLLKSEVQMLQVLDYELYPMTPNIWIQLFLQIRCILRHEATKQGSQISTLADTAPSSSSIRTSDDDLEEVYGSRLMVLASCALEQEAAKENSWEVISSSSEQEDCETVIDLTNCESSESEELEADVQTPLVNMEVGEEEEEDSIDSDTVELTSDNNEDAEYDDVEVTVVDGEEHDAAEPAMMVLDEEAKRVFEISRMQLQEFQQTLHVELEEEDWGVIPEGVQLLEFDSYQNLQEDQQALAKESMQGFELSRIQLQEFQQTLHVELEEEDWGVNPEGVQLLEFDSDQNLQENQQALYEDGMQGFELSRMHLQDFQENLQIELEEEDWGVKTEGVQLLEFDSDENLQEDQQALDEERMALLEFHRSVQEDEKKKDEAKSLLLPAYSEHEYMQVSRLMDSMMLDRLSLHFSYKHIAAAAVMLSTDMKMWEIPMVTGVTFPEIEQCVHLMKIHKDVISRYEPQDVYVREFEGIKESDSHKIQYSTISSEIWEDAVQQTDRHWNLQYLMGIVNMERQRRST